MKREVAAADKLHFRRGGALGSGDARGLLAVVRIGPYAAALRGIDGRGEQGVCDGVGVALDGAAVKCRLRIGVQGDGGVG